MNPFSLTRQQEHPWKRSRPDRPTGGSLMHDDYEQDTDAEIVDILLLTAVPTRVSPAVTTNAMNTARNAYSIRS